MCKKENTKMCSDKVECTCRNNTYDYLIILVLYILLVIILGACLF